MAEITPRGLKNGKHYLLWSKISTKCFGQIMTHILTYICMCDQNDIQARDCLLISTESR